MYFFGYQLKALIGLQWRRTFHHHHFLHLLSIIKKNKYLITLTP